MTRQIYSVVGITLAWLAIASVASAQPDTPAARDARQLLRAIEQKFSSRVGWDEWSQRMRYKDLEFELRAGDRAEGDVLAATAAQIRAGAKTDYRAALLQQLAPLLETRAAELAAIPAAQWPAECAARADQPVAVTPAQVQAGRDQLARRLNALERRLPSIVRRGDAWRTFLSYGVTRSLTTTDVQDADLLDRLEARWQGAISVWDAPELVEASLAVQSYIRLYRGFLAQETLEQQAAAWQELGKLLESSDQLFSGDRARIAELVHQRERLGQSSALTSSIRRQFSRPNIIVQARIDWLQAQSAAPINEPYQIDDVIAGARSVGSGTLAATMHWRILPSSSVGQAILQLNGTSRARTTGGSEGVTVASHATTGIRGEKAFLLDARGLSTSPAKASARTSIVYDSIDAPGFRRRRTESIRQTYARRPQAEAEAAAASRRAIIARLDADGGEMIGKFNRSYVELRNHQLDHQRAAPEVRIRATSDLASWECRLESPALFAAPGPPPEFEPTADLTVCIAASALEEQCLASLAGKQLTGEQLSKVIGQLWGTSAPAEDTPQDFRATFADRPCDIQFAAGKLLAKFYITSFDSEDVQFPAMTVDAAYNLEQRGNDLALVREGSLRVRPVAEGGDAGEATLSGRQQTLRLAVQRKLNKALADTFIWASPATPATANPQAKLQVGRAQVDGGWLQVAFTRAK